MRIELQSRPSYGMATVHLDGGESFVAESGAMVAMGPQLSVETRVNGASAGGLLGWLKAIVTGLARKFLAGESLFVNHFRANANGQQVMLAPTMVGDVEHLELDQGRSVRVQATSFLGAGEAVHIQLLWAGFQMLLSREGAFFLECRGTGPLLINTYGALHEVQIDGSYVVDTGHLVAFEGDLTWRLRRAGGWKATLLSGEGLVMSFEGKGTLWLQTRNMTTLVSWLTPQLPA